MKFILSNQKEVEAWLDGVDKALYNPTIEKALKDAGEYILGRAYANLFGTKKGKSLTQYSAYTRRTFVIKKMRRLSPEKAGGIRLGIDKSIPGAYKLRWIEWGTGERRAVQRRKDNSGGYLRKTGKLLPENFFYSAVSSSEKEVSKIIAKGFEKSLKDYENKG